jgi:hypothetical protein
MKPKPYGSVPKMSMTAFAPTRVRERKMRRGTSGAGWRDSIRTKAATRTADPERKRIVRRSPQPLLGASTTP